ncbi:hypothetical protein [Desulforhabdus amnigena]|jgi:hypothetical protein|uniref:Uncharacterized protein n=1 Tax=Desulforhabdus amnigena TaxID=40218 RepID=A0A9W6L9L5_9BACT|nr:hypothetical protein [Desulforhabdus amnigena]NLJ28234.1 hypothetical protein [Deltaproteobacteria bacterium]GLI35355.1 hypothetical protein DAMNIGENAA_27880 [Desulforhabdus amnigena]
MDNDLITGLTRQVKDEVVENYLTERRIVGLQIEEIEQMAGEMRLRAERAGRRLSRLSFLMVHGEMRERLSRMLRIQENSFWSECMKREFSKGVRFIRVKALTDKGKFKKLVQESYCRLYRRMEKYRAAYEELVAECEAVNINIRAFQKNFDVLTLLAFLRSLDTQELERKHFLGENFTPEELGSLDQKLYIKPIAFESLEVPPPLELSPPERMELPLSELAAEIYRKHERNVKYLMTH